MSPFGKKVVILVRNPDTGEWSTDGQLYTPKRAEKLVSFNRIIGGIESRTFPAFEYAKNNPEVELWEF